MESPKGYPTDDYRSPVDFSLAESAEGQVSFQVFNNSKQICEDYGNLGDYPTKVFIHGWLSSIEKSKWYIFTRDAYLENGNYNVLFVDYQPVAAKLFSIAAASSKNVAKEIAQFLIKLKVKTEDVHLLGHSLGSHVAGFVGRYLKITYGKSIGRITALDPGGPKFQYSPERLHKDDALFLDIVHTDDGHYGLADPIGHVDFYPNGGKNQPGCPSLDIDDNCSHARSTLFFFESINYPHKLGHHAKSWDEFKNGKFSSEKSVIFGDQCPVDATGSYYFKTNDKSPFLKDF